MEDLAKPHMPNHSKHGMGEFQSLCQALLKRLLYSYLGWNNPKS